MSVSASRRRVLVIGGGYVGAPLARALDKDYDVTLVDKLPVFFHRMAALRAAVDPAATEGAFLSRERLLNRGRVVTGEVAALRPEAREVELVGGEVLAYDVAIIATGIVNQPVAQFMGDDLDAARAHFGRLQADIADASAVLVVGGGITGVELAGEITSRHPGKSVVLLTRSGITPHLPEKAARGLREQLERRGVRIVTGRTVDPSDDQGAARAVGLDPADTAVIWTTGGSPAVDWLRETHPEWVGEGGIVVDAHLRVGGRDDLYAVGDVAATAGEKAAMNARTQIPVITANLAAGRPVKTFRPGGPRIALVPLGPEGGVVSVGVGKATLLLGPRATSFAKGRSLMTPMMDKALGNV